jgi:hypothetical protein
MRLIWCLLFLIALTDEVLAQNAPAQAPDFFSATPFTVSATGTTDITTATIQANSGLVIYLCGFSIRANATVATNGMASVTGLVSGTLSFVQWTAASVSGVGVIEPPFGSICIPASGTNVAVSIASAATGAGGMVSVTAWGFYHASPN